MEQLSTWGGGQLLAFSGLDGPTDYRSGLVARTATAGGTGVEIMLPAYAHLRFDAATPHETDITGDSLAVGTASGSTRMVFLDAHHVLIEGPCAVGKLPDELRSVSRGDRMLVGSAAHFDDALLESDFETTWSARRRWLCDRRGLLTGEPEARKRTAVKCLSIMKTQVCSPEGKITHRWTTPDRWPHRNMWLWDSAFHAIGWRHVDAALAKEMLLAVLDMQHADGRIPISNNPFFEKTSGYTQPPVLTLAAALVDELAPDDEWLAAVYPRLRAYVEWDLKNRDTDGDGLLEWAIEGNPGCRSGESGADNSTRFDSATQLDAPDFNAMIALELELLAAIASRLCRPDEARELLSRQQTICRLMNERLWDDDAGLYIDAHAGTAERTGVLSYAGFLPLICGAASREQAGRIVSHLSNPATFGRPLPIPTISASDAGYKKDMWRGPAWVNINWLVERGLRRYGYTKEADRIVTTTCEVIERMYAQLGSIFEYYDDEDALVPPELDRKGANDGSRWIHRVIHDYGWSATLYVDWTLRGRS
ncbi:MAG: flagellar biosynthesis protein FlgM [Spirochaetaceae bacterium]|nr:MAG: flagellar biosynthesis protein FlgM [Spirochaetaceae bacterium]